jgi:uncharacterized protein (DUF433 family)
MSDAKIYVRTDEHGVLRVGQTRVPLESVVYAFQAGHSPETIQDQYPALSLEEVNGAIAYYLANREAVHEYLQRQQKLWDEGRRRAEREPNPVVERLRALRAASRQEKG